MPTVLVVDDSDVDRRLVGGLLGQHGNLKVEFATNGVEALDILNSEPPDLIVTDLQMPEMDGLELVTAARLSHPHVPLVLMTAHGSETLAVEALEQGAASYVSKSQLAEKLADTVQEILAMARADRSYSKLISSLRGAKFEFELQNDPAVIDPLVDLVQQMVAGMELCDFNDRVRVGVALKEGLLNALYRGNLEITPEQMQEAREDLIEGRGMSIVQGRQAESPYCDRRIHVRVDIGRDLAEFIIRDEGPGFDPEAVLDPADTAAMGGESGRGLWLMRSFMDEVAFNDSGNEVTLVKRGSREEPAGATQESETGAQG